MDIAKFCTADNLPDVAVTLMKTLCRSHALFATTFSIVIDPEMVMETEGSCAYTYLSMLLRFVEVMTNHVSTICLTESERYLQICRKTRMFDAFERALENAHLSPDVIRKNAPIPCFLWSNVLTAFLFQGSVVSILMGLRSLLKDNPHLISIIRSEFPRPRILHGLLHVTFGVPHSDTLSWFVRTPSVRQPILMSWLLGYWALYALCEVDGDCMRRVCKSRRRKRCKACKWTKYCGEYCQKEDWEEHKLICGLAFDERAHATIRHYKDLVDTVTTPLLHSVCRCQNLPSALAVRFTLSAVAALLSFVATAHAAAASAAIVESAAVAATATAALDARSTAPRQLRMIGGKGQITWILDTHVGQTVSSMEGVAYFTGAALPTLQGNGTFNLTLPEGGQVVLKLFDELGNQVVDWDGSGRQTPAGSLLPAAGASIAGTWA
ncbi:uncharacterized protein STEHIDRAFT_143198 [Stereum hirsutum FP-91666 SS1]|uniref:MYND-type domain-containing protein n=1 Tax=Stereum hirsutum (strain FP-91666) TaxID=721885 RepID=R7RW29_STEHR|nr:uncharacterized protein STEHIDRAFT_143198 [Stereum hirsutum FP-91666 SS1]EIM79501.1 hypothetical protein STEHIDRAFT_143198 [Stereum hirsutum FP-91666 SS1]